MSSCWEADFVSLRAEYVAQLVTIAIKVPAAVGAIAVRGNHDLSADDHEICRQ